MVGEGRNALLLSRLVGNADLCLSPSLSKQLRVLSVLLGAGTGNSELLCGVPGFV